LASDSLRSQFAIKVKGEARRSLPTYFQLIAQASLIPGLSVVAFGYAGRGRLGKLRRATYDLCYRYFILAIIS